MQTLESQYGREPLSVPDETPTVALRSILGWTHVATPDGEVEQLVRERAAKNGYTEEQLAHTIEAALWIHEENRAEYRWVMGGMPTT